MLTTVDLTIINSMARTLFLMLWEERNEQEGNPTQGEIDDKAPKHTPAACVGMAYYFAGRIAQANTRTLHFLLRDALGADLKRTLLRLEPGDEKQLTDEYAKRFGHCLVMMLTGQGVSWFDDHAKFRMFVPNVEWSLLGFDDDVFHGIHLDGKAGRDVRDEVDSIETGLENMSRDPDLDSHLTSAANVLDAIGRPQYIHG